MQIDDEPGAIGRFHAVTVSVLADARLALSGLLDSLDGNAQDQRPDVARRRALWRAEKARRVADDRGRGVSAAAVFEALSRWLPAEAASMSATTPPSAVTSSQGQPVLMSGYLGSIGFDTRPLWAHGRPIRVGRCWQSLEMAASPSTRWS